MKNIILETLKPQGKVVTKYHNGIMEMAASIRVGSYHHPKAPALVTPDKYNLPFRIDLTANMDAVGLYVIIGKGIVPFKAGSEGRTICDIVDVESKSLTKLRMFDASFALNEDTNITIIYDQKFMMIQINGEVRFLSKKERYMKSPLFSEANEEGFEIKIAVEKHTNMIIKSFAVTEFTDSEISIIRDEIKDKESIGLEVPASVADKGKETFDECIAMLPDKIKQEIVKTNDHLLTMKDLKVKRKIEGTHRYCRISYNSPEYGFGYHIDVSNDWTTHSFWFSMHFNTKYGAFGARKCDYTEAMLKKLHETAPETAERIFDYYGDCGYCGYIMKNGRTGACSTVYEYNGVKKTTCHGKIKMNMKIETFNDIRKMFDALREVITV